MTESASPGLDKIAPLPDATQLLMADHLEAKALFQQYRALADAGADGDQRRSLANRICSALSVRCPGRATGGAQDRVDGGHERASASLNPALGGGVLLRRCGHDPCDVGIGFVAGTSRRSRPSFAQPAQPVLAIVTLAC